MSLLNRMKEYFAPTAAAIVETNTGFVLFNGTGELIGSYSRRRDAVRGAKRRGLEVA